MRKRKLLMFFAMALLWPAAIMAQVSLPYTSGFDTEEELAGWTTYNMQSGGGLFSEQQNSGDYCFGFRYTTNPPQYLISPELTGTDNGVAVEFYYKAYSTQYGSETFEVGYSLTTSDVSDEDAWTWEEEVTVNNTDYQPYNTTLPAGVKYVAVKCTSYDVLYLFVDDFSFTVPGAAVCVRPSGVTAADVTYESAVISWTPGNDEQDLWQVSYYTEKGGSPADGNIVRVNTTSCTLQDLTPETKYYVAVRALCSEDNPSPWSSEASFTTPEQYTRPTDVTADNITTTTADISWTSAADATASNLRYREGFFLDFEDGGLPDGWIILDRDGDGNNWEVQDWSQSEDYMDRAHSGFYTLGSASYINNVGALTPDNWLISPKVSLGGNFSFYARGRDASFAAEHFAIFVSTTGTNPSDFKQVSEEFEGTGTMTEYSADLSAYAGKKGYIAIRHFNVTDMFVIDIDDVNYQLDDWTVMEGVTSPTALTELTSASAYVVQVQSVYGEATSNWTGTNFCTVDLKAPPSDVTADNITSSSADIEWTVNGEETVWNLRYRPTAEALGVDFETRDLNGWTTIDDDGDGHNWFIYPVSTSSYEYGHNSANCIASASYDNDTYSALTPDNWLISPKTKLSGTFSFYAKAASSSYSQEKFAMYVSTDSNTDVSDFVLASDTITAAANWTKYTVDLSKFNGVEGYVAIRHFYCTDMYLLLVDDIAFESENDAPWVDVNGVTEQPVELSDLEGGTTYEVQVQAVYDDDSTSAWAAGEFTTLVDLVLLDNDYEQEEGSKNTDILKANLGKTANVTLSGRTFYKDGKWNTIALPFDIDAADIASSPLAGATVVYPGSSSTVEGTHVTLNLTSYPIANYGFPAGTPLFVKWESGENIVDPVFNGVTISEYDDMNILPFNSDYSIIGIYTYSSLMLYPPTELEDGEELVYYMGDNGNLRYTGKQRLLNAFRGGLVFYGGDSTALEFILNFDEGGSITGIAEIDGANAKAAPEGFYNIQGVKLNGMPKQKGVYINNGKKVIIK